MAKRKQQNAEAHQYHFELEVLNSALLKVNAAKIISAALLEGTTIQHFELYPSIVGNQEIGTLNFQSSILKAQNCKWDDTPVTMGAKVVTACGFSVMIEICQWDVERTYVAALLKEGRDFTTEVIPSILQTALEDLILEKINEELELITWLGNTELDEEEYGSLALCDGLEVKYLEAIETGAIPLGNVVVPQVITKDNVIAFLSSVYQMLPKPLITRKRALKAFISSDIATAYRIATASQSNEIYFLQDRPLTFLEMELVEATGARDSTLAISFKPNFAKLTDIKGNAPKFNSVDMNKTTNEPNMRMRSNFKFGVDILNEGEHFVMLSSDVYPASGLTSLSPTSGAVDATVTITGTNLEFVYAVDFGGELIENEDIERVSGTQIKVKVPSLSAGAKVVKLKGLKGDSTTANFTIS